MGWGQAQLTGLPCSGSSSHCPGASLAIGGHQQLPPPSRADSTSPRSWLGSAGPRQGGGGGEPLLLSQQLLLPLPVLLKLWLWTQGGGGSQSPAAPDPPAPPQRSTSSPWPSQLVIYSPQAPNEELDLASLKCQQLWPLPQGCSQMLSPLQMCSARTRGRAGEGLSSGGAGIPCRLVQGPAPPQL